MQMSDATRMANIFEGRKDAMKSPKGQKAKRKSKSAKDKGKGKAKGTNNAKRKGQENAAAHLFDDNDRQHELNASSDDDMNMPLSAVSH